MFLDGESDVNVQKCSPPSEPDSGAPAPLFFHLNSPFLLINILRTKGAFGCKLALKVTFSVIFLSNVTSWCAQTHLLMWKSVLLLL